MLVALLAFFRRLLQRLLTISIRSMEAQFTEYESAAYAVFVVLLSRIIATYELNLYIPISKVRKHVTQSLCSPALLLCFLSSVSLQ